MSYLSSYMLIVSLSELLFLWGYVIFTPDSPKTPSSSPDFHTDS